MFTVVLSYLVLTTTEGAELHWNRANVPYEFNASGSADMGPEVYPALDAGFQVWNDASQVDYSYAGCTSKGRGSVIDGGGDASSDGSSIVTWIESNWPYGPGTIAITWTYFFADGEIDEADMLMNGEDYFWTTSTGAADTDVQSITAHEAGHYLGLGHTDVASATMFATVDAGETSKRSLHADDIAGAEYIYGSGASSGATFDGECKGGGGGGGEGCGCTLEGTATPRPGLLAGILSVLAFGIFGMMRMRSAPQPVLRLARRVRANAVFAIAGLALFATRDASATTMIDQSLEGLAAESQSVVHGDVLLVETLTDGRIIWTRQEIRVREVLAGLAVGETVEVITPGGELPKGVRGPRGLAGAKAAGIPEFTVGQEVVVFLTPSRGERKFLTVTALQQGVFVVRREAASATVVRDVTGLLRMERTEEGLKAVHADDLSGLPLETLAARIRALPTRVTPAR